MEASTLTLCILLVSILAYKLLLGPRHRKGKEPPGPSRLPLLGNILDLRGGELHRVLARLAAAHGPVMSLRLGTARVVVVSSAAGARDTLQRHDAVLSGRAVNDAARALGNHEHAILWLPAGGALFRRLRAIYANHLFSARGLGATRPAREAKVRELVGWLRDRRRAGAPVDVGAVVLAGMLNLMSNVLLSEDLSKLAASVPAGGGAEEVQALITRSIEVLTKPNVSDLFPALAALDLQGRRRENAVYIGRLYDFFDGVISRRKSAGGQRKDDFLDVLLQLNAEDQLSTHTLKSILLDMFAAGTSTTALTVQWTMAELLRHPAAMAEAVGELRRVLGSKQHPDESDLDKLPYLRAAVMEAMRLHPPAPLMLPHVAMAGGAEVGGYPVPEGTRVIINLWAIMRDPACWEDPEAFAPGRFLAAPDLDFRGMDARAFVPFGAGRRACPGMPMATRSMMLILASMLHAFEWGLPDGMKPGDVDVRDRFGSSLEMLTPLMAIPKPVSVSE